MKTKNTQKVVIYLGAFLLITGLSIGFAFSKDIAFFGKTQVTGTAANCAYAFAAEPETLKIKSGESRSTTVTIKGIPLPPTTDVTCANDSVQLQIWDTPAQANWGWCTASPQTVSGTSTDVTITCTPPANVQSSYDALLRILRNNEPTSTATMKFEFEKTPCTGFFLTLDKQEYKPEDTLRLTYSCASPADGIAEKLLIQLMNGGMATDITTLSNVSSGTYDIPLAQFKDQTGNFLLRTCIGDACGANNTNSTSFTFKSETAKQPVACKTGEKCPNGSWCESGAQFYYPNGEITCVAWPTGGSMDEITAPEGTSDCATSDASCINRGTVVPYSNNKWCRYGKTFYSKDGTKMTCGKYSSDAPTGYSPCRPDDANCIPSGSYGPKSGWCSDGMKFYQKATDSNPNNDVYCAKYAGTGTAAAGMYAEQPTPPAGYSACDPDDKNCKQKGESWTQSDSSIYCMNGQKCAVSSGGGSCVGWNEECPKGTKYCTDSSSENCVEPGEYKAISATSGMSGSYWCGGSSGGMVFYSTGKAYCAQKKTKPASGSTTGWSWTADEIKEVLAGLGSGWGLCRSSDTNCIEPGKTGPSNGWCAWWPPSQTYTSTYPSATAIRACPSFDGETVVKEEPKKEEPKKEEPKKEEPKKEEPKKEICAQVLTQAYNPKTNECKTYGTPCEVPTDWVKGTPATGCAATKPVICPMAPAVPACTAGETLITTTTPDGCGMSYCKKSEQPIPPVFPPGMKACRVLDDQARSYKYEIRNFEQMLKSLPKDVKAPANIKDLIAKAKSEYERVKSLEDETACAEEMSGKNGMTTIETVMQELRNSASDMELHRRCSDFQRMITDRTKTLKDEAKRLRDSNIAFSDEIKELGNILNKSRSTCAEKDREAIDDLNFDLRDVEEQISDKYMELSEKQRSSFMEDTIKNLYAGITALRTNITEEEILSKPTCAKIPALLDEMENLTKEAEKQYKNNNIEGAAIILDKIERFKEPIEESLMQCNPLRMSKFTTATSKALIYKGIQGIDEASVEKAIDNIVDKFASKFQAMFDEKIAELTAKVSKLTETLQVKLTESLNALQAIPKDKREIVQATKTEFIETIDAIKPIIAKLNLADSTRLNSALEKAAKINWCGQYAEDLKKQAETIQLKAKEEDITIDDITFFETAVATYESHNSEECYATGVTRFRDVSPDIWYYPYIQAGTFFKGTTDAAGNLTGNVEPARSLIRAEALVAIQRALNVGQADGDCPILKANAKGVPAWANCAVNYAANAGMQFAGKLDEFISRDELASWISVLAGSKLPASGSDKYIQKFSDIDLCKANKDPASVMVANKIMTGMGGEGQAKWGCGQPLLRAELAAILTRLADLASLLK